MWGRGFMGCQLQIAQRVGVFNILLRQSNNDTRNSLQSPLSKNQTKLHGLPQLFNHIFLLISRKYVCVANEKYNLYRSLLTAVKRLCF